LQENRQIFAQHPEIPAVGKSSFAWISFILRRRDGHSAGQLH
jgi:hypothetical protein